MKIHTCGLDGLKIIELAVHHDQRGFFIERFNQKQFHTLGLSTQFFQDNHSRSYPNVVRGLHAQHTPPQGKLVGVLRGAIWDVAVDIRPDSPTFGKHFSVELSDENGRLLWIPSGFAHGFCVLGTTPADVMYKVDAPYNPTGEVALLWNDPELDIPWPLENPIISVRDSASHSFKDYRLRHATFFRAMSVV